MNLTVVLAGCIITLIGTIVTGVGWNWDKLQRHNKPLLTEAQKTRQSADNIHIEQTGSGNLAVGKVENNEVHLNLSVQRRTILPDAAKILVDHLVQLPSEKIELRYLMNDAETQNFSFLLKDIFVKSNWSVIGELQVFPNKPMKNIVMGVPEKKKDDMTVLILYNWFNQNGFKPIAELLKDKDEIVVLVGSME